MQINPKLKMNISNRVKKLRVFQFIHWVETKNNNYWIYDYTLTYVSGT